MALALEAGGCTDEHGCSGTLVVVASMVEKGSSSWLCEAIAKLERLGEGVRCLRL